MFYIIFDCLLYISLTRLNVPQIQTYNINPYINSETPENQILNIHGKYINIGDQNSIVRIQGTTTYIASTELLTNEKTLTLNSKYIDYIEPLDNGYLCGIEILGLNRTGFIRTNIDSTRFEILPPGGNNATNYILTVDLDNNLTISGVTNLLGSLNVLDTAILMDLEVSNTTKLFNDVFLYSNLFVSNNTILYNNTSVISSLYVSGKTILESLNVNNNTILNDTYINTTLNISGLTNVNNMIVNNNITVLFDIFFLFNCFL